MLLAQLLHSLMHFWHFFLLQRFTPPLDLLFYFANNSGPHLVLLERDAHQGSGIVLQQLKKLLSKALRK